MRRLFLVFIPIVLLAVGCGNNLLKPGGSATINGAVVGSAGGSSSTPGSASAGMNVSVVGGNSNATVDTNGKFRLTGIHPGSNVEIRFTGKGANVKITVGEIEDGDDVTITVVRDGADFKLDCTHRHGRDGEQLEGRIDGLPPTTPAGTFTVSGQNVQTDADTKFFKGDAPATFADLQLGMRVHVSGTPNANGVKARIVRIQNVNVDLSFEVEGTISAFTGTAADFQFIVDNRLVRGNASTTFNDGKSFANLANGVRVEAKTQIRIGFLLATRIEVQ